MKRYENNNCYFFVGGNARENWQLLDQSEPHDLFFHAEDVKSAYAIAALKNTSRDHSQEDIRYAASLLNQNGFIMYTPVRHVVKGKCTGEVFVNEYNTIRTSI